MERPARVAAAGRATVSALAVADTVLEYALAYAARGWRVVPLYSPTEQGGCTCGDPDCESPGKHPRLKDWPNRASTDPKVITEWWRRWPDANVGIATGAASNLVVVDLDKGGRETLADLESEHGPLPATPVSHTGGGGEHRLFKHPGVTIPNKVSIGKGLDIRGDGGQIVAAPSMHAAGREYVWSPSAHPDDTPLADMPAWLVTLIRGTDRDNGHHAEPLPTEIIAGGGRNNALASLAGTLRRRGLGETEIFDSLQSVNASRCKPPLPDSEVRTIAQSVARYPAGELVTPTISGTAPASEPGDDALPVHLTDLGNSRRLVRRYGNQLRYCHPWGRWLVWDSRRWALDDTARVERAAKATVAGIYAEAAACPEDSHRKELAKHALRSEAATKLGAMMALARSEPGIPVLPDALDADPWLLTVQNGTLDLHTGELQPHSPGDLITKLAPVAYDAAATCPRWLDFLAETFEGNAALIAYVQKMAGYALTGDTSEQSLFVLWGTGQNGKSTMLSALGALLGDYWKQTPTETLLARSGNTIPNDVAALKGARLVTAIEADEGRRLAESLVKQMTGGDPLAARFMRAEWFNFVPTFKLFLATNHKPEIRGTDLAIWRRIRLIPFRVTVPEGKQDKHLGDKLQNELPGILAWAVRGCLAWQQEGMAPPAEVVAATTQYREEMDPLADFLAERCMELPGVATEAGTLFKAYSEWCERGGEKPLNQRQFGLRLAERGYAKDRNTVTRRYQYHGLALRASDEA